jgi:beta-N-acetylhexosaminidase
VCAGFPGAEPDASTLSELAALAPAGLVLFSRNVSSPEATRALVAAACAASGPQTFVAIDQEGGRVARLRSGFRPIPSMMALGACGDAGLAERLGTTIALDLARVGSNVDFAPVLDLALEPANTVIGTRSFGDDPVRAGVLGSALVRGLQGAGIVATLKHFPGHGATKLDSHRALPQLETDAATLHRRELVPFAAAIAQGARAVMSAHILVPALDAEFPATLSRPILNDLLRGELGFRGVCFTDALEMAALADSVGSARAAVLAIAAGADCVVASEGLELARSVCSALRVAVESGELPLARLREAAARTARLREGLPCAASSEAFAARTDDDPGMLVARGAITLLRGSAGLDSERAVSIVSFEGSEFDGAGGGGGGDRPSLNLALRRRRLKSESLRVPLDPEPEMIAHLLEVLEKLNHQLVLVMRRAHLYDGQRAAVKALLGAVPQAVAVSALEPFDAPLAMRARGILCTYGDDECAIEALADVLSGRATATGTLPVRLEWPKP